MTPTARNWVFGVIIMVGLGSGAIALIARGSAAPMATDAARMTVHGVCLSCKSEADLRAPAGERPPHACPKCGQKGVYSWWVCLDCDKRFVPGLSKGDPGNPPCVPTTVWCVNCQSTSVMPYVPQAQTEPLAGDAPLPAWPQ